MSGFHLAQINIAQPKGDIDDPIMAGFVARIDEINALAEQSDGFVWRLIAAAGEPTGIPVFDDANMLVNMSVWQDIEALKHFVYHTAHLELLKDKSAWFDKMASQHQCMWWIPAGHVPTLEEAKQRLDELQANGPSERAFTFSKPFPAPRD